MILGLLMLQLLQTPEPLGDPVKVLIVGDSWSELMWFYRTMQAVFNDHGHPEWTEKGDVTAISGSKASEWVQPSYLQLIDDELAANPSIEIVQLTLGGNDFLAGLPGGGWHSGLDLNQEEQLFASISSDVLTVIQHILDQAPQVQILLTHYDYTNFVESLNGPLAFICNGTFSDLGQPTPFEINSAQTRFHDYLDDQVMGLERVHSVRHLGAMQFLYGYPSMNIPPMTLILPGDLDLPSPPEAMALGADCFHLNQTGYRYLGERLWDSFYSTWICPGLAVLQAGYPNWPNSDLTQFVGIVNRFCPSGRGG